MTRPTLKNRRKKSSPRRPKLPPPRKTEARTKKRARTKLLHTITMAIAILIMEVLRGSA